MFFFFTVVLSYLHIIYHIEYGLSMIRLLFTCYKIATDLIRTNEFDIPARFVAVTSSEKRYLLIIRWNLAKHLPDVGRRHTQRY
jgi:hypothetical protein